MSSHGPRSSWEHSSFFSITLAPRNIVPLPESENKQSMEEKKINENNYRLQGINRSCVNSLQAGVGHDVRH